MKRVPTRQSAAERNYRRDLRERMLALAMTTDFRPKTIQAAMLCAQAMTRMVADDEVLGIDSLSDESMPKRVSGGAATTSH